MNGFSDLMKLSPSFDLNQNHTMSIRMLLAWKNNFYI